jgi:hypothetical protein
MQTSNQTAALDRRSVSIIYGALVVGAVLTLVGFGLVREVVSQEPPDLPLLAVRLVAFAELAAVVVIARIVRMRIQPYDGATDEHAWWRHHGARGIIIWALAEGSTLFGAVLWFISGDRLILAGVAGVSLALLVAFRPARLLQA